MCWVTHTPASQPGVLQAPGTAVTGLPALSAEQAVLSVTLICARTHWPASQPGVLQVPGMAVTGLPALSVEHGRLSEIGRGSGRERAEMSVGGVSLQRKAGKGGSGWAGE